MGIWSAPRIAADTTFEELKEIMALVIKDMDFTTNGNIDSRNVREIGGYKVDLTSLASKNGVVGLSSAITGGDDIRIWAGDSARPDAPFRVYESGLMIASNAQITGKITAFEGKIGEWVIDSEGLSGPGVITGGTINGTNINGAVINGGSINVDTDVYIGDKLHIDATNFLAGISFDFATGLPAEVYVDSATRAMRIFTTSSVYINNMDVVAEINSLKARVSTLEAAP